MDGEHEAPEVVEVRPEVGGEAGGHGDAAGDARLPYGQRADDVLDAPLFSPQHLRQTGWGQGGVRVESGRVTRAQAASQASVTRTQAASQASVTRAQAASQRHEPGASFTPLTILPVEWHHGSSRLGWYVLQRAHHGVSAGENKGPHRLEQCVPQSTQWSIGDR